MATLPPSELTRLTHDKHHSPVLTTSLASYRVSVATENHVYGASRTGSRSAAPSNPSTNYTTYLDPNIQQLGNLDYYKPDENGYTCYPEVAAGHSQSVNDDQLQAGHHAATYELAGRLSSRSNGAPLATIVEQGSYSTLNSHGSLLSVGRFTSTKAAETTSPSRGARRRSRSLDEKALPDIEEDLTRELNTFEAAVPQQKLVRERKATDTTSSTATPSTYYHFETQSPPSSQTVEEPANHRDGKVKGLMRGVLQNVTGVPRAQSRSSSSTHAPIVEHRSRPISFSGSSASINQQGQLIEAADLPKHSRYTSTRLSEGAAAQGALRNQLTSRATPSWRVDIPAQNYLCPTTSHSEITERGNDAGFVSPVFPSSDATCSRERFYSTSVVLAETRDVAQDHGTIQAQSSHHDISDTSVHYSFDDISIYRGQASSDQSERMRSVKDKFASQNASFCSNMSTSYSGTVLGVDLDLQHEVTRPVRRSQSPPTPVWFTPQMAELERLASSSESLESERAFVPTQGPCHSITSSALTALLPIAEATGIVQPNYNTPTISFYSPSGNPIQPESSSPRCTSSSDYPGSPTISTSYYTRQHTNAVASARTRLTRPPLLPMTTPPTEKVTFPMHLQYHHNYRHPKMSQSTSRDSCYTPRGPVMGCDGFVREENLFPRSGFLYPYETNKVRRSTKLIMHDLKADVKFYKARFLATAAAQSFVPSIPQWKSLQKRHLHDFNTYTKDSLTSNAETKKGRLNLDRLGPLAAHTLRVCFCQPYDGAGNWTRATAVGSCLIGEPSTVNDESKRNQCAKDAELLLPNARVIGKQRHGSCGDTKRATKNDSALSRSTRRASYTSKRR